MSEKNIRTSWKFPTPPITFLMVRPEVSDVQKNNGDPVTG